jgi:RNA polymerase sigma-70 factor, ECF subfamily
MTRPARPLSRGARATEQGNSHLVAAAIGRAQDGDIDALGFLYARYADSIYAYVRSIVHDHHVAEDVTQQVFAKLMTVIGKYEERDVPFLSWVLRVSRNAALDHLGNDRLVPVEEVRVAGTVGGDQPARARLEALCEALAALPAEQRKVLMLRHLGGYSPSEIARVIGRTEGSIHGLHHRGRRTAAALLRDRGLAPATVARRRA